jgi:hypothetical protein
MLETYLGQLGVRSEQQSTCFFFQYRYPVLLVKPCLYLLSGRTQILERYRFSCHRLHFSAHQVNFTTYIEKNTEVEATTLQ